MVMLFSYNTYKHNLKGHVSDGIYNKEMWMHRKRFSLADRKCPAQKAELWCLRKYWWGFTKGRIKFENPTYKLRHCGRLHIGCQRSKDSENLQRKQFTCAYPRVGHGYQAFSIQKQHSPSLRTNGGHRASN